MWYLLHGDPYVYRVSYIIRWYLFTSKRVYINSDLLCLDARLGTKCQFKWTELSSII